MGGSCLYGVCLNEAVVCWWNGIKHETTIDHEKDVSASLHVKTKILFINAHKHCVLFQYTISECVSCVVVTSKIWYEDIFYFVSSILVINANSLLQLDIW